MLSGWRTTSSYPQIWSSSLLRNRRPCVISRQPISTGAFYLSGPASVRLLITSHSETNLKIKQGHRETARYLSPSMVTSLRGQLRSEQPNNSLYTYSATLELSTPNSSIPKQIPMGPDQILLRGAQLRNTPWLYGLVVFTGHQTKLMRNATAAPIKRTNVEREVNTNIVWLFILLLILSIVSTVGSSIRTWFFSSKLWYLNDGNAGRSKGMSISSTYPSRWRAHYIIW